MNHMKRFIQLTLLFAAVLWALAACTGNKTTGNTQTAGKENTYSYDYVKQICVTQPKKALTLLQTADDKSLMPKLEINMLRSMVYYNSMLDYTQALHYAEEALKDPDIDNQPEKLMKVLNMASLEYYYSGNYARSLALAARAVDEAYKNNDNRILAQVLTTMGQCHSVVGNLMHAIHSFDRVISILSKEAKKSTDWNTYYELTTAYAMKGNALLDMKNYADLLKMRPDYEETLNKLNTLPEAISGINDQANATFYCLYSLGYEQNGNHAEGARMYDKLSATRTVSTPEGATFVVSYLLLKKQYAEAMKRVEEEEQVWERSGKDSIDFDYSNHILMNKARALKGLGRYKEAIETGMRAYDLSDSLARHLKSQNAIYLSEKLGNDFLVKYIGRQKQILKINTITLIAIAVLLAVFVSLTVYVFRANRKLKNKNKSASKLIGELLLYKKELMEHLANNAAQEAETEKQKEENQQKYEDFLNMEKLIFEKKLFLQPKLERGDVARETGMSTTRFNALFSKFSDQSFNNYINDLRMEYAAKLLKEKSNYTIEAIAAECGVPIRQTFHRLFSKKFGMTPAEYRNNIGGGVNPAPWSYHKSLAVKASESTDATAGTPAQ